MNKVISAVSELAEPIVVRNGCELWGVEYVKEAGYWFLRVFIDHRDGVSINHCESISRELDPILDSHEDLIPTSYTFEVSSPGVERRLRGPSDFERFAGSYVELKLYKAKDGQKVYQGNLAGWDEKGVELEASEKRLSFETSEVASVKLKLES